MLFDNFRAAPIFRRFLGGSEEGPRDNTCQLPGMGCRGSEVGSLTSLASA